MKTAGVWSSGEKESTSSCTKLWLEIRIPVCLDSGQTKVTSFYLYQMQIIFFNPLIDMQSF